MSISSYYKERDEFLEFAEREAGEQKQGMCVIASPKSDFRTYQAPEGYTKGLARLKMAWEPVKSVQN